MSKKPKKKATRGCGITITIPTEPIAGASKKAGIMAVMVVDEEAEDGGKILEYEIPEGQSITFRVGGSTKAYMERVGPAPEGEVWAITDGGNPGAVTVKFEHALSGPQMVVLDPGSRLTINPVVSRRWEMSSEKWEG